MITLGEIKIPEPTITPTRIDIPFIRFKFFSSFTEFSPILLLKFNHQLQIEKLSSNISLKNYFTNYEMIPNISVLGFGFQVSLIIL